MEVGPGPHLWAGEGGMGLKVKVRGRWAVFTRYSSVPLGSTCWVLRCARPCPEQGGPEGQGVAVASPSGSLQSKADGVLG